MDLSQEVLEEAETPQQPDAAKFQPVQPEPPPPHPLEWITKSKGAPEADVAVAKRWMQTGEFQSIADLQREFESVCADVHKLRQREARFEADPLLARASVHACDVVPVRLRPY